jgi:hypothetical protein
MKSEGGYFCKIDFDGFLDCLKCGEIPDGDWEDYGIYKALKWVLGEGELS